MVDPKKCRMTPSDVALHFRLLNYLVKSGAAEEEVESFITNVNSGYIPLGKAIELVNQIYDISKSRSVPLDQLPNYVREKLLLTCAISKKFVLGGVSISFVMFLSTLHDIDLVFSLFGIQ